MSRPFFLGLLIFFVVAAPVAVAASFPVRLLNAITGRSGFTVERDLAYGALPRQSLDIYRPDNAASDAPVVVFFYGGGWNAGEKKSFFFVGQSLATAGFIVVIPDYRLHPEVVFPAFVEDGARTVAFARETLRKPDGSPRDVFLAGHSAGAHIAALLNLDEHFLRDAGVPANAVAGMVGLAGPYDFLPLREDTYKRTFPEAVRKASQPINFVDGTEPPMLLVTGDADRTVRPGNSTRLAAAVEAEGGEATVRIYPRMGHLRPIAALATALPFQPDIRQQVIDFIEAHRSR